MLLIPCPHCGPRDHVEFAFGGDASVQRPADGETDAWDARWESYVYSRDNPRGRHVEWWHHSAGCRRWIRVERDTLTHQVTASADAAAPAPDAPAPDPPAAP
jgi:heterotetrameric sarcosine oxidase delta subunit